MKSCYSFLLFILLFVSNPTCSETRPFRTWLNLTHNSHFSSKPDWLYGYLLEGRFNDQPGLFYQALVQGQTGYQASKVTQLWLGATSMPRTIVGPKGRINSNVNRIYQQIDHNWYKNLSYEVTSRSRMEERHKEGDKGLGVVYRQLFLLRVPKLVFRKTFTPLLSNELFFNLNKPAWSNQKSINQNRFLAGWDFPCSHYICRIAYVNQYVLGLYNEHEINHVLFISLIV